MLAASALKRTPECITLEGLSRGLPTVCILRRNQTLPAILPSPTTCKLMVTGTGAGAPILALKATGTESESFSTITPAFVHGKGTPLREIRRP